MKITQVSLCLFILSCFMFIQHQYSLRLLARYSVDTFARQNIADNLIIFLILSIVLAAASLLLLIVSFLKK